MGGKKNTIQSVCVCACGIFRVHFVTNFFLIFFPEFFVNFFFSFVNVQLMPLHEREGGKISVNWRSSCTVLGLQLDGNQVENLEKHILKQKKRERNEGRI
jgi:hypothetical protein